MFDDLHDQDPPTPDMATLAAVSGRARSIRRHRLAVVSSLSTVAVVAVAVAVVARDDDPGRIAIVDDPSVTESPITDPSPQTDPPDTTGTGQTDPPVVPSSDPGATDTSPAPVDCPAVGLRYVGVGVSAALINDFTVGVTDTTDDPGPLHAERGVEVVEGDVIFGIGRGLSESGQLNAGAKDAGTVTLPNGRELHVAIGVNVRDGDGAQRVPCLLDSAVYDPELDMLESQDDRMIVAIDGDGDAVVRQFTRSVAVLHDGTDPDDALPEEGEVTYVDGVAVPLSYDEAWVGICCEPVAGSLLRTAIGETATYEDSSAGFGHAPALSPDDGYLAAIDYLGVQIRDLDSGEQIVIDLQADEYQQATSIVWTGTERLAVQIATDTTSRIVEYMIVEGEAVEASSLAVASGTSGFEPMVQLVGAGALRGAPVESARVVWLWNREQATLDAMSLDVFSDTPETTLQAPSDATVVRVLGNEVRWVDESRRLWTAPLDESSDPEQIPGEYVWVG